MKIEWFGHSCFKINDSLVIDPYKDGSVPGYGMLRVTGDKVICTHEHADHSGRECVTLSGKPCVLQIREIASWHDDQGGTLRGPNTIFIIEDSGEKLVHLGDLGHFPNEEQLAAIRNADYLLIPIGGHYTIDGYPEISTPDAFLEAIKKTTLASSVAIQEFARD